MVKSKYLELYDIDLSDYRQVFVFEHSSHSILSIAIEPWAAVVKLNNGDCMAIYTPFETYGPVEFVEDKDNERMIAVNADKMCVKINNQLIAQFPNYFPKEKK